MMQFEQLAIRWHSRAGQGAVTAAGFLSEALGALGNEVMNFPDFGAEKRGAPVVVYNRVGKIDPAHPRKVDLVVLLDPSLVGAEITHEDVLTGLKSDGMLVINTEKIEPSKFAEKFSGKIIHTPATRIAREILGRNLPNVAMIGTLTRLLKLPDEKMRTLLSQHLAKFFVPGIVEKNLVGFDRGGEEFMIFEKK